MILQSMKGQNSEPEQDLVELSKVNLVVQMAQNLDVAERIYYDYMENYIYINTYYWKWYFIYLTAFLTLIVMLFALNLVHKFVVKPITEITHIIENASNHKNQIDQGIAKKESKGIL